LILPSKLSASERPVLYSEHLFHPILFYKTASIATKTIVYALWHIYGYKKSVSLLVNRLVGSKGKGWSASLYLFPG
jgi:hypothetical protein